MVDGVDFIKPEKVTGLSISSNLTDKQELQQLKMKHGTWALGPLLVTPTSHFQKDLIALLANPCWGHHSKRAESVLTPKQVQEWISSMAKGGWKQEILDLMLQGFQTVDVMKRLYPVNLVAPEVQAARIQIHFDFLTKLMAKRASSLAYTYLRPPLIFCFAGSSP